MLSAASLHHRVPQRGRHLPFDDQRSNITHSHNSELSTSSASRAFESFAADGQRVDRDVVPLRVEVGSVVFARPRVKEIPPDLFLTDRKSTRLNSSHQLKSHA